MEFTSRLAKVVWLYMLVGLIELQNNVERTLALPKNKLIWFFAFAKHLNEFNRSLDPRANIFKHNEISQQSNKLIHEHFMIFILQRNIIIIRSNGPE